MLEYAAQMLDGGAGPKDVTHRRLLLGFEHLEKDPHRIPHGIGR
ncbi:hypothetical protein [Mesorhizobium waimense]|nr:hypothetical protein [Mesorhizobium waimense]